MVAALWIVIRTNGRSHHEDREDSDPIVVAPNKPYTVGLFVCQGERHTQSDTETPTMTTSPRNMAIASRMRRAT